MFNGSSPLLRVRNLSRHYGPSCAACAGLTGPERETNVCPRCGGTVACRDVSFDLFPGEVLGIVGESGSGKSTLLRCLNFDESPSAGEMFYSGAGNGLANLFTLSAQRKRAARSSLFGIVYQSPHLGLNLDLSAGANVAERLLVQDNTPAYGQVRGRTISLLNQVRMPESRVDELSKTFSGGMQQRVQLAKALGPRPKLLFLDEPTSGLDVSVQASVLDLIASLQRETGVSMLVVSHDLGVVRLLTHRTLVMKMGRVVEQGLTDQVLEDPRHAYTQQLVASVL